MSGGWPERHAAFRNRLAQNSRRPAQHVALVLLGQLPVFSGQPRHPRPASLGQRALRMASLRLCSRSRLRAMWQGQPSTSTSAALMSEAGADSGRLTAVLGQLVALASAGGQVASELPRNLAQGLCGLREFAECQARCSSGQQPERWADGAAGGAQGPSPRRSMHLNWSHISGPKPWVVIAYGSPSEIATIQSYRSRKGRSQVARFLSGNTVGQHCIRNRRSTG